MKKCRVSFENLLDFREDRLDGPARKRLQHHLDAGCAACASGLVTLDRLLNALRAHDFEHAPDTSREAARATFRERLEAIRRNRQVARVVFDSRLSGSAAGARGDGEPVVQLLYTTDHYDVDIWQERDPDAGWYVIGQILPRAGDAAIIPESVTLEAGGRRALTAHQEAGEFHLPAVPEGTYELTLRLQNVAVSVPGLTVGIQDPS